MRLAVPLLLLGLCHCAATRSVRPLGEGRTAGGVSLGGPVFTSLGLPIPVPLGSAYVRRGLTPLTDLDAGLHLPVSAAMGLDLGLSHQVLAPQGLIPAVSLGGRAYFFWNALRLAGQPDPQTGRAYPWGARAFEDAYALASWQPSERWLVWTGAELLAQAEDLQVDPVLLVGAEFRPSPAVGLQLELKDALPLTDAKPLVVQYLGIAGPDTRGALIVQLGVNLYLPGAAP